MTPVRVQVQESKIMDPQQQRPRKGLSMQGACAGALSQGTHRQAARAKSHFSNSGQMRPRGTGLMPTRARECTISK